MLLLAPAALAEDAAVDVRHGIPAEAYIAAYGQSNPERDFQRQYGREIWQTVRDEKLPERVAAIVLDALPAAQRESADSINAELQTIFEAVDWSAVGESPECVYGQVMVTPQSQHLLILRLPSADVAESLEDALIKFGQMVERRGGEAVRAATDSSAAAAIHSLSFPQFKEFPFQPSCARLNDVIVLSSSEPLVRQSVDLMLDGGASKFDDPRLKVALEKLPAPEDAQVFYDGRLQFQSMRDIGKFIREKAANDPNADRAARILEQVIDQLAILDYEATVEYTDANRNCQQSLGRLVPGAEEKLLARVLTQGAPFENWQRWVPADAQAYMLTSGANLHVLYEGVMKFLRDEVPESQPALEKLEALQAEWGVHLDRDVLQSFSGECVSLKLPAASPGVIGGQDQVLALRCQNPERIRELIGQGVGRLQEIPWFGAQQLQFGPAEKLSGFDQLSLSMLAGMGVKPVVGFHEGWMIVATNAEAAEKVIKTLAGEAPSIDSTKEFQRFGLQIDGPVYAISYTDLAASTRQAAQFIRQAGMAAPIAIGVAGAKAKPGELKPLQDAVALLPSIANVVEKFDFLEARLRITQAGDEPGTYVKRCVTLVRPSQGTTTAN